MRCCRNICTTFRYFYWIPVLSSMQYVSTGYHLWVVKTVVGYATVHVCRTVCWPLVLPMKSFLIFQRFEYVSCFLCHLWLHLTVGVDFSLLLASLFKNTSLMSIFYVGIWAVQTLNWCVFFLRQIGGGQYSHLFRMLNFASPEVLHREGETVASLSIDV